VPDARKEIESNYSCDPVHKNTLIPAELVNKLVSLANHPSTRILQTFAVDAMKP
jgi:hypothetical protein